MRIKLWANVYPYQIEKPEDIFWQGQPQHPVPDAVLVRLEAEIPDEAITGEVRFSAEATIEES